MTTVPIRETKTHHPSQERSMKPERERLLWRKLLRPRAFPPGRGVGVLTLYLKPKKGLSKRPLEGLLTGD